MVCPHRFDQLLSLGKQVSSRSSSGSNSDLVQEKMRLLSQERESLREAWEKRNKELKQCSELQVRNAFSYHLHSTPHTTHSTPHTFTLHSSHHTLHHSHPPLTRRHSTSHPHTPLITPSQLFLRDAEQVDSAISGQEAFLANEDVGTSVDSVEELLSKHEEFSRKSSSIDDRIRGLSEQANRLVHAGHYDAERCGHLCSKLQSCDYLRWFL